MKCLEADAGNDSGSYLVLAAMQIYFFFRPHQPQDTLYDLVIAESATKLKVYSIQARSQAFP